MTTDAEDAPVPKGRWLRFFRLLADHRQEALSTAAFLVVALFATTHLAPELLLRPLLSAYAWLLVNSPLWVNVATTLLVLITGFALFQVRSARRKVYGLVEILVAIAVAWDTLAAATVRETLPIRLAGAVYFVVRGLDNYKQGRDAESTESDETIKATPRRLLPLWIAPLPGIWGIIPWGWPLVTMQLRKAIAYFYFLVVAGVVNFYSGVAGKLLLGGLVVLAVEDNLRTARIARICGVPTAFPRKEFADRWRSMWRPLLPLWRRRECHGPDEPSASTPR